MGLVWMVAAVLASWAFNALVYLVWRPRAITRQLRAQGVGGPAYKFFAGNLGEIKRLRADTAGAALNVGSHDFVPRVQPHFRKWIAIHGRTFLYWFGARPTLCVADVSVVKQVLSDRSGMYPKNVGNPHIARLLGKGLVLTDGDEWKRHRKVVHPAFNMDKLKAGSSFWKKKLNPPVRMPKAGKTRAHKKKTTPAQELPESDNSEEEMETSHADAPELDSRRQTRSVGSEELLAGLPNSPAPRKRPAEEMPPSSGDSTASKLPPLKINPEAQAKRRKTGGSTASPTVHEPEHAKPDTPAPAEARKNAPADAPQL